MLGQRQAPYGRLIKSKVKYFDAIGNQLVLSVVLSWTLVAFAVGRNNRQRFPIVHKQYLFGVS
jgi:hypothetical protein